MSEYCHNGSAWQCPGQGSPGALSIETAAPEQQPRFFAARHEFDEGLRMAFNALGLLRPESLFTIDG
jgi:hypothetical protein